jgi:hypothetical protein
MSVSSALLACLPFGTKHRIIHDYMKCDICSAVNFGTIGLYLQYMSIQTDDVYPIAIKAHLSTSVLGSVPILEMFLYCTVYLFRHTVRIVGGNVRR